MPRWTEVILITALVTTVIAFFYGQSVGYARAQAKQAIAVQQAQAIAVRSAELASRKEAERLAAETARANLALQLEDAAREEPVTAPACFPVSRVLRLNQR